MYQQPSDNQFSDTFGSQSPANKPMVSSSTTNLPFDRRSNGHDYLRSSASHSENPLQTSGNFNRPNLQTTNPEESKRVINFLTDQVSTLVGEIHHLSGLVDQLMNEHSFIRDQYNQLKKKVGISSHQNSLQSPQPYRDASYNKINETIRAIAVEKQKINDLLKNSQSPSGIGGGNSRRNQDNPLSHLPHSLWEEKLETQRRLRDRINELEREVTLLTAENARLSALKGVPISSGLLDQSGQSYGLNNSAFGSPYNRRRSGSQRGSTSNKQYDSRPVSHQNDITSSNQSIRNNTQAPYSTMGTGSVFRQNYSPFQNTKKPSGSQPVKQ